MDHPTKYLIALVRSSGPWGIYDKRWFIGFNVTRTKINKLEARWFSLNFREFFNDMFRGFKTTLWPSREYGIPIS